MIKNNFVIRFFVAALFTLGLVAALIYLYVWTNDSKLNGKLVFAKTYNVGTSIDKIELQSAEETVTLLQKDSYWLVENKNNYYADFLLVNMLLDAINKSIYSIRFPYDEKTVNEKFLNNPAKTKENSGILIKTYAKDKLIDEIIVGIPDESKNYYFSRNLQDDNIWLISEKFNFPLYARDWIVRPILTVPQKQIEVLQIDDKKINRLEELKPFYNEQNGVVNADVLTSVLSKLFVIDAIPANKFDKRISDDGLKTKKIIISTFMGLIFELDLYYSNSNRVWCKIKLLSTSLPLYIVNDYINDNKFLYDDWYFEISHEQGHILRDFRLY